MSIVMAGPVAYLPESEAAVFFSKPSASAGTANNYQGTVAPIRKMENKLNIAFWGEDNRFPQNIATQMAWCGIGKEALNWKAEMLYGNGIVPGKITGVEDDGTEIFAPLDRAKNKAIYSFIEKSLHNRFWLEYFQDWVWFGNCFPELILSKDAKKITGFVHQESCDARFTQMNATGRMEYVYLTKLWGADKDQYAQFDPTKAIRGVMNTSGNPDLIEDKFLNKVDCIDMYNPLKSLTEIGDKLLQARGKNAFKSAIFPTNYPSPNKTYYQVPAWDGARLAGWAEIAAKIPALMKALYEKAFRIRYHIQVPDTFFVDKYEDWDKKDDNQKLQARKDLLDEMSKNLSGSENAYKSFITFYKIGGQDHKEYGNLKITEVPDTSKLDKEFITQSAADIQLVSAMGIDPTLFSAGTIGTGQQRSGGSDKREAFLIYCARLFLQRQVALEPMYLVRDYNEWGDDIVFRFRDIVLTTLDTGKGTEKKLS